MHTTTTRSLIRDSQSPETSQMPINSRTDVIAALPYHRTVRQEQMTGTTQMYHTIDAGQRADGHTRGRTVCLHVHAI